MINLLRADIYKLFKGKSMYICSVLSSLFVLLSLKFYQTSNGQSMSDMKDCTVWGLLPGIFCYKLLILLTISVSLFSSYDLSKGTIKNCVSKGFKREFIYLSKTIVSMLVFFVFMAINLLTYFIASPFMFKAGEVSQGFVANLFTMVGLETLAYAAIVSVIVFISMLTRSTSGAISVSLCTIFFSPIVLRWISMIIMNSSGNFVDMALYWVYEYPCLLARYSFEQDLIIRSIIVSVVTIAFTNLFGIYVFKKRDIT